MTSTTGTVYLVPLENDEVTLCRVVTDEPPAPRVVVVSAWIGRRADVTPALLERPEARAILVLTHHGWRNRPCVFSIDRSLTNPYRVVGCIEPSDADRTLRRVEPGAWVSVADQRLAQAEWDRDADAVRATDRAASRAALRQDRAALAAAKVAKAAAKVAKAAARRAAPKPAHARGPSLTTLARRAWFASWAPYRTRAQIAAARAVVVDAATRLIARPRRPAGDLAELRRATRALNRLGVRDPDLITTIEAEELHAALLALAAACGLDEDDAAEAVDTIRDW